MARPRRDERREWFGREPEAAPAPQAAPTVEAPAKQQQNKVGRAEAAATRAADATNARFGNDMAWLDTQFQESPQLLGKSARGEVFADPRLVAAQNQALDQLFGIARDGGATALERARMASARGDQESWLRGQREADMADLSERGMSGSGQELLALAQDRQAAASRLSQADLETEAMLEQRALDATMRGGELAGKMRDTGFAEGQERATAQDEFALLNQQALNKAGAANKQFQQNAWSDMMQRRNEWDKSRMELGLDAAGGLLNSDAQQNQAGFNYSGSVASQSANQANQGKQDWNSALGAPNQAEQTAQQQGDAWRDQMWNGVGQTSDQVVSMAAGGAGGPMAGAAAGGVGKSAQPKPPIYDEEEVFG